MIPSSTDAAARLRFRQAARCVVVDPHGRVLLLLHPVAHVAPGFGGLWATPGGEVEAGESVVTAALRELGEECGLDPAAVEVVAGGRPLWLRAVTVRAGGLIVRQAETFVGVRVGAEATAAAVRPGTLTADVIAARRWWSAAELAATTERLTPARIGDLAVIVARGRR